MMKNVFDFKVSRIKMFLLCLIFNETMLPVMAKTTPGNNNSL